MREEGGWLPIVVGGGCGGTTREEVLLGSFDG